MREYGYEAERQISDCDVCQDFNVVSLLNRRVAIMEVCYCGDLDFVRLNDPWRKAAGLPAYSVSILLNAFDSQ